MEVGGPSAAAVLAVATLLAAAAFGLGHGALMPDEGLGQPMGLASLTLIGPPGTQVEQGPCDAVPGLNDPHIGHVFAVEDLQAAAAGLPNRFLKPDSVSLWHLDTYEEPNDLTGPPFDGGNVMLGTDGYARGEMQTVVKDGPGFDLAVHDYHPWSSYCVWGSRMSASGPFLFVGSSFPEKGQLLSRLDLTYYYDPLHQAQYPGEPIELRHVLLVGSTDKYHAIKAAFTMSAAASVPANTGLITFADQSSRYGWPERPSVTNNEPDPIDLWEWAWDTDPGPASNLNLSAAQLLSTGAATPAGLFPPGKPGAYVPGLYDICLRVTAFDDGVGKTYPPYNPGWGFSGATTQSEPACVSLDVIATPNVPPVAVATATMLDSASYSLDGSGSFDPDAACITAYEWDIGGEASASTVKLTHTFAEVGAKLVRLRVQDCAGAWSPWSEVWVTVENLPPSLTQLPDALATVGAVFSFTVAIADSDLEDVGFTWVQAPPGSTHAAAAGSTKASSPFFWDTAGQAPGTYALEVHGHDAFGHTVTSLGQIHLVAAAVDADGDGMADAADPCPAALASGCAPGLAGLPTGVVQPEPTRAAAAPSRHVAASAMDDRDRDGVADGADNCVAVPNRDQADLDGDAQGDLCDTDADGDDVAQAGLAADNCPTQPNPDQADADGDGTGDACDARPQRTEAAAAQPATLAGPRSSSLWREGSLMALVGACSTLLAMAAVVAAARLRRR